MLDPHRLGASLYVPATHPKLASVLAGREYAFLRSVIACTEDAVAENDLENALDSLRDALTALHGRSGMTLRFVRARNPEVLERVLAMEGIGQVDGFVLPKLTRANLPRYLRVLGKHRHLVMPTLETVEVFDSGEMRALGRVLARPANRQRVLALRVGGSDLLRLLGMRRPRGATLYDTPLGALMAQLHLCFRPLGFQLTAPVFDFLDEPELLEQEVRRDIAFGFCGKTAVHPRQVPLIERAFQVAPAELAAARRLTSPSCPAVFQLDGTMYEASVHRSWAEQVFARAQHFGVAGALEGAE